MSIVRLGAVGYLNARPLVYGLERSGDFAVRFDVPSQCAALLHEGAIDIGLIPSIEYLHGPAGHDGPAKAGHYISGAAERGYRIVPDLAIASRGPVASVALFTTRPIADVRSIAVDTSSRTSVALLRVLCARDFGIHPTLRAERPDLTAMLSGADAALIIGDNALFQPAAGRPEALVEKIDLGEAWTAMTGLPFVYAFWAGRPGAVTERQVHALQQARDEGMVCVDEIARRYCPDSEERQATAAGYLRDNIKYHLGSDEQAGLELFFQYAVDTGAVESGGKLRFY